MTNDQKDFYNFMHEMGWSLRKVNKVVQNVADILHDDISKNSCVLRPSSIHGTGIFTEAPIKENELIGFARIDNKRTYFGRYMNHSTNANCRFTIQNNSVEVYATRMVTIGEELTVNYREVYKERVKVGDLQ